MEGSKSRAEFCNVRHAATIWMRNDFSLGVTELRVLLSLQLFDDKSGCTIELPFILPENPTQYSKVFPKNWLDSVYVLTVRFYRF